MQEGACHVQSGRTIIAVLRDIVTEEPTRRMGVPAGPAPIGVFTMTTEPATPLDTIKSVPVLLASLGCAVGIAWLWKQQDWYGPAIIAPMTLAIGLPTSIALSISRRRQEKLAAMTHSPADALRRPTAFVVMLFAATIYFLDSTVGAIQAALRAVAAGCDVVWGCVAGTAGHPPPRLIADTLQELWTFAGFGCLALGLFLASSYASHFLGAHGYLWTAVTVGVALAIRAIVVFVVLGASDVMIMVALHHLLILLICLAGAWFGRRHHAEFVAHKLRRLTPTPLAPEAAPTI